MQDYFLRKLEHYYRESEEMERLWRNQDDFLQLLSFSLDVDFSLSEKTSLHEHAKYFISYTSVFLVKDIFDLDLIAKKIGPKTGVFMRLFFNNDLIDNDFIKKIVYDSDFIGRIEGYPEWIEYPLIIAARSVISNKKQKSIDIKDIIPSKFSISSYLEEYLLSWAHEEGKLSANAETYFKINFHKKYRTISDILQNK